MIQIVDLHREDVISEPHLPRNIEFKARVTALVATESLIIQPEFGNAVDAFKFQEDSLPGEPGVKRKMFPVPADATPVSGLGVAHVMRVPGMRQFDVLPP